ncbi:MAG: YceI family protein [Opitutaceae bacterium]|nr:YceI family protein [Opitutaceae bacterium]
MKVTFTMLLIAFIALTSASASTLFEIDKDLSVVAVDVKASPPHSFTVTLKDYEAEIQIDPVNKQIESVSFTFKFSDLDSKKKKRDKKMRKWMDIQKHPDVLFTLTAAEKIEGKTVGRGDFLMHGVSREITIPFDLTVNGDKAILDGGTIINHHEWELETISLLFLKVKPELNIHFHLEGSLVED